MSGSAVPTTLEVQAERVAMAMAEAGLPALVMIQRGLLTFRPLDPAVDAKSEAAGRVWHRALDLAGYTHRCFSCWLLDPTAWVRRDDLGVRVSPDCEGTGWCAS